MDYLEGIWVPFTYETLPVGCGRLGHGVKDYEHLSDEEKQCPNNDQPFTVALKAKSNFWGKESYRLNSLVRKGIQQNSYVSVGPNIPNKNVHNDCHSIVPTTEERLSLVTWVMI